MSAARQLILKEGKMSQVRKAMTLAAMLVALAFVIVASGGTVEAAGLCVNPGGTHGCYASIQAAINAAASGSTISIKPGTYRENITVTQSVTLAGAGDDTIIEPAISNPNPCTGSSLCGSPNAASNIFLVQANNVTIQNMLLDGHNPLLHSGIVRGGVDLDARNGIIENFYAGVFNNLQVRHVTIKNIYLRGVYASSGGTFTFRDNVVQNVQGDYYSIAMFNFGGSGVFANNRVSYANDAISANWSMGTQFLNNTITQSGSGVHTDNNGGSGGVADLIRGNEISNCAANGYGIFVFVPYVSPTVANNDISHCSVGLAAYGEAVPVTTTFSDNTVNGMKGSTGVFITDDQLGYGANSISVVFLGNVIKNNAIGFDLERTVSSNTVAATLHNNDIENNTTGVNNNSGGVTDATHNWWGCAKGPGAPGCNNIVNVGGSVTNYVPFLKKPNQH